MKKNIKIVFFGTPDFVKPVKEALAEKFDLVLTVDNPNQLNDELTQNLAILRPDLFIVAAFGKILGEEILGIPKYGSLNIHPSLLPKFRGPSPIQAAILSKVAKTGVTVIKMDQEMDHGSIVFQQEIILSDKDNFDILSKKLFLMGADALLDLIPDFIEGKIKLIEQNDSSATFCKLIKKDDGYFPISEVPDPEVLDRMIRAYYPWPGVWTKWEGKIVKFLPSPRHPERSEGSHDFLIQMEGKKAVPLKNFLNGYPNFPIKDF